MSKSQSKAARQARRERRARRSKVAFIVTNHLIKPSLSKAQVAKLLAEFAKLKGGAK